LYQDQLLCNKFASGFWSLPGGRAEVGESAEETLIREMQEELGIDVQVERLVFVVENFFEFRDIKFHELNFYFLMKLPEDCYLYNGEKHFERPEHNEALIFDWLPIDELARLEVYPEFLRTALKQLPEQITHIINREHS
jgi:ADP-ribose pyrophosphatase YjhB (NUDIX family)